MVARGWGRGNGELFDGDRVSVLQDERVLLCPLHHSVNILNTDMYA